jgi:hypothetical protein
MISLCRELAEKTMICELIGMFSASSRLVRKALSLLVSSFTSPFAHFLLQLGKAVLRLRFQVGVRRGFEINHPWLFRLRSRGGGDHHQQGQRQDRERIVLYGLVRLPKAHQRTSVISRSLFTFPMPSLQPRRAGVLVPVFAIRTPDDLGIGDIGGVRQLIDWAADTGLGLVQFLPINATGSDSSPYNAISSVALDYLTLDLTPQAVPELDEKFYATITGILRADLLRQGSVNYPKVRRLKNTLLRRAFSQIETQPGRMAEFEAFCVKEAAWLDDFCLFKVLMEEHGHEDWTNWRET